MGSLQTCLAMDQENHEYTLTTPDGPRVLPGVTSLLKNAGIGPRYYNNSTAAADFGTVGHEIVRLYLSDDLDEYDPEFEPWMSGIRRFKSECRPGSFVLETLVHSMRFGYAGTLDFLGEITPPRGRRDTYLIDWKFWAQATGEALGAAELQTAAYSIAALELGLTRRAPYRAVVHFYQGGYRLYTLNDPAAKSVWLSVINIETWKAQKGLK